MWFALYYLIAVIVLVMHFTGTLARRDWNWMMYILAVTVFPAALWL